MAAQGQGSAIMRPFRRSERSLCLGLALGLGLVLLSAPAGAAELREGIAAYEQGDYPRAAGLLGPLAEGGDPRAQYLLGRMRFYGQGLDQDASVAAAWYRRSAEQGHAQAQLALGLALDGGWGVSREPDQAVEWYRRAAVQGVAGAMWSLAFHYRRGLGVTQDLVEAWAWFDCLAAQGDMRAVVERDWLALLGLDEAGLLRAKARSDAIGLALEAAALSWWTEAGPPAPEPPLAPP